MSIYDDFLAIFHICKHKNLIYISIATSINSINPRYKYICDDCSKIIIADHDKNIIRVLE